jgi:hypothetical protein
VAALPQCPSAEEDLFPSRVLPKNVKIRIYKTIICPVDLYGCETWSLTIREEHNLRVLRRIFGPKRSEYSSNDEVKEDGMDGTRSTNVEKRNAYRTLRKPDGQRPLERSRRRWVDNTSTAMALRDAG